MASSGGSGSGTLRGERLRRSPLVYLEPDFIDPAGRARLLALGEAAEQADVPGSKRDSTGFSYELDTASEEGAASLALRIAALTGLVPTPTLRYRRYRSGESHAHHLDHFEAGGEWLLVTAMVILRAPELGGATSFPHATPRLRVEPTAGALVLWLNHLRDGSTDRLSGHEGEVVRTGEKVTVTSFQYGALGAVPELWARFDP